MPDYLAHYAALREHLADLRGGGIEQLAEMGGVERPRAALLRDEIRTLRNHEVLLSRTAASALAAGLSERESKRAAIDALKRMVTEDRGSKNAAEHEIAEVLVMVLFDDWADGGTP